jgi:hypothetical protein
MVLLRFLLLAFWPFCHQIGASAGLLIERGLPELRGPFNGEDTIKTAFSSLRQLVNCEKSGL